MLCHATLRRDRGEEWGRAGDPGPATSANVLPDQLQPHSQTLVLRRPLLLHNPRTVCVVLPQSTGPVQPIEPCVVSKPPDLPQRRVHLGQCPLLAVRPLLQRGDVALVPRIRLLEYPPLVLKGPGGGRAVLWVGIGGLG